MVNSTKNRIQTKVFPHPKLSFLGKFLISDFNFVSFEFHLCVWQFCVLCMEMQVQLASSSRNSLVEFPTPLAISRNKSLNHRLKWNESVVSINGNGNRRRHQNFAKFVFKEVKRINFPSKKNPEGYLTKTSDLSLDGMVIQGAVKKHEYKWKLQFESLTGP